MRRSPQAKIDRLRVELAEAKGLLRNFRDCEHTDPETGPSMDWDALHKAFASLEAKGRAYLRRPRK